MPVNLVGHPGKRQNYFFTLKKGMLYGQGFAPPAKFKWLLLPQYLTKKLQILKLRLSYMSTRHQIMCKNPPPFS